MSPAPLTGGCLCGAVRFEVLEPPPEAGYCHCTRCRRRTGTAASVQASVVPGSVRIVQGEDALRAWEPPGGFAKVFCGECGAHLFSRPPGETAPGAVRLGAFDEDPGVRPSYRQHVGSAAPWEPLPDDGLPRYEGPRPG
jgi:hypothetical protein